MFGSTVGVAVARDGALVMTEDGNALFGGLRLCETPVVRKHRRREWPEVSGGDSHPPPGRQLHGAGFLHLLTWASSPEIVTLTETPTQLVLRDNT